MNVQMKLKLVSAHFLSCSCSDNSTLPAVFQSYPAGLFSFLFFLSLIHIEELYSKFFMHAITDEFNSPFSTTKDYKFSFCYIPLLPK